MFYESQLVQAKSPSSCASNITISYKVGQLIVPLRFH